MKLLLAMSISYLLGSIPTAYILGQLYKGIDIREHGSGNIGATNVFRVLGKGPGFQVLILDILKGVLAVAVVADIFGLTKLLERLMMAVCVVSGHNWTVFLKFKGGKGIATSLGVLLGLTVRVHSIIPVVLLTLLIWIGFFLTTKFVSLSSVMAAIFLPFVMIMTRQPFELVGLGIIFCIFVVIRHRPNIRRLLSGDEPRVPLFVKKKK